MLLLDASFNDDVWSKKKFLWVRQPATFIKLMKISVCYKKKGTWWAYFSADARTIWSRQRCTMHIHPKWRQTFLKNSSLFFLCDEVRVKWFKYCNHQQKKNSSTASKENSCNVIKAVFQRAQFPPPSLLNLCNGFALKEMRNSLAP